CAGYTPPGRLRARWSASTPRGSGARPPTRRRIPACRPARPARARPGSAGARCLRPTAEAADARRRSRTSSGGLSRRRQRVELGEDVGAVRTLEYPVLDLAEDRLAGLHAPRAERVVEILLPDPTDHLGARIARAALAYPRAIAHLGERGLEV